MFLTCLARAVFKGVHTIIGWKGPQAIIQSSVLLKADQVIWFVRLDQVYPVRPWQTPGTQSTLGIWALAPVLDHQHGEKVFLTSSLNISCFNLSSLPLVQNASLWRPWLHRCDSLHVRIARLLGVAPKAFSFAGWTSPHPSACFHRVSAPALWASCPSAELTPVSQHHVLEASKLDAIF